MLGRGGEHQIDAIADYMLQQPFSNPQRLLIEAKFLSKPVGIPVARQAVGILKDVQEYWHSGQKTKIPKSRYSYSYAIFSALGYKKTTQAYAFAQDIYLISLAKSAFFKNVIDTIRLVAQNSTVIGNWWPSGRSLGTVRRYVRRALHRINSTASNHEEQLGIYLASCRQLDFALLGLINGRFPIFLVPAEGVVVGDLLNVITVKPKWDDDSWYLFDQWDNQLFSFDLPEELFAMYAEDGILTAQAALNLKQVEMGEIQTVVVIDEIVRVIRFQLDSGWIEELLKRSDARSSTGE